MSTESSPAVKDSGQRQKFETGARRDTQIGKGRFDLMPPRAMSALAKLNEAGALKYDAWNVAKGMPVARLIDSGLRHVNRWMDGERDEDHLTMAMWNFGWAKETVVRILFGDLPRSLLDGLPPWTPELHLIMPETKPAGLATALRGTSHDHTCRTTPGRKVHRRFRCLKPLEGICPEGVIYVDGTGQWIMADGLPADYGPSKNIARAVLSKLQDSQWYEVDAEANTHADCSTLEAAKTSMSSAEWERAYVNSPF